MKIYVVDYRDEAYQSKGFSFHASKAKANQAVKAAKDVTPNLDCEISASTFKLTKSGVIQLLEKHAMHPDNG